MVESAAVVFREDFLRIPFADCTDSIRTDNRTLQKIDAAVVLDDIAIPFGKLEHIGKDREIIDTLVVDVVDREQCVNGLVCRDMRVFPLQIDHGQSRLPVVGVENVGIEIDRCHQLQNRLAKICKPFAVVKAAVERRTIEIILVVDEIEDYPFRYGLPDTAILVPPRQLDIDLPDQLDLLGEFLADRRIQRNDHADVALVAQLPSDCLGKRTDHVRQSSGRYIRKCFGCCIQNFFHWKTSLHFLSKKSSFHFELLQRCTDSCI